MRQWVEADDFVLRSQLQAQKKLTDADIAIQKYWADIESMRTEQEQHIYQQCEKNILEKQIKWLVSIDTLQDQITTRLQEKIKLGMTLILQQWYSTQRIDQNLVTHLYLQLEKYFKHDHELTLTTHPDNKNTLMEISQTYGITLLTDNNFPNDEIQLRSPRQLIKFSLSRYLNQLLDWLAPLKNNTLNIKNNLIKKPTIKVFTIKKE
ncbi:MAG: hypothetical protein ACRCVE_11825 [Plesiomonas sp.]